MKFGIFYELQLPRPWEGDAEHDLVQHALDQIELADRLGFDHAWEVEHHFLEEYSHSSAPEVFLAAASQRTRNIRLGHGIVQLPTNHPARVAERVATLDLVSSGRVELGLGEGSSITELHPFGRRFRDKRLVFEDAVRCLMPMFGDDAVEYHGEYFDFPLRNVLPKPRQKPHPPLWVACSQLDTIEQAGRWGFGALGFQFASADAANAWVSAYYHAYLHQPERITDYVTNPNISVVCGFMCAETDEEAQRRAEGWTFFQFSLGFYSRYGVVEPGTVNLWDEYQQWRAEPKNAAKAAGGLVGSPETIRKKLRKFEATHIDQVILLNQAGKNTHEHICESLELFAREVMPEFHDRESEHQDWKQQILAGEIEVPEVDLTPYRRPTNATPTLKPGDDQPSALSVTGGPPA
ncbi:MAG TPA: LLM class flavin-dependent oxidoreductase [Acidimicrobiales bacterium]|nr:LLM class flavin-dependent oxidoreductase [Acidimicrobiales bacterium]